MNLSLAAWQEEIVFHPARFQFLAGGRRVGKSHQAACRIIVRSIQNPGHRAMYLSPVSSQAEDVAETILSQEGIEDYLEQTRVRPLRFWWKNGSRTEFRSLERPRNLRSRGYSDVIFDESQDGQESIFDSVIRPLVSDRCGSILLLGQFRGKDWRYRRYFEPGQELPGTPLNPIDFGSPRYKSWRIPSSLGVAFQSDEGRAELELAKSHLPSFLWKQEYDCELASNPSCVFPSDQLERITKGAPLAKPEEGAFYVMGLDLGRVRDPSACVIMDIASGAVVHVEKFPLGEEHSVQAMRAAALKKKWNDAQVICDTTGGASPGGHVPLDQYTKLYREKMESLRGVWINSYVKVEMIGALTLDIEQERVSIPAAFTDLLDELQSYECEYSNGFYRFHGPGGHRDDLLMALAFCVWARKKGWAYALNGAGYSGLI